MCYESNHKPLVICPELLAKWKEEEELRLIMEEEEKKKKKLEEERENAIRNIKTLRANTLDEWKLCLNEISNCNIPTNESDIVNKYIPDNCKCEGISNHLTIIHCISPMDTSQFG